ncbi:MAG: ATP-grasp domain-containing protein [Chitinophagaceae bacterium]|nr:MAG: ATP-grasp domain-containing protein [Chitinophagaceae bacterium]
MNILLTSVGRRSYIISYFKDSMKGIGQVHAANSFETYAMKLADKSVITPLIYNEEYIDFLINYSKQNSITAIISLFDIDLPVLALNKHIFDEHGITIVVSDYETTQICNDKWKTYNYLDSNGFYTPKSFININDCLISLKNKDISFPLMVKPRWGMGSIGLYSADNINELEVFYKKAKVDINNSYLKYESVFDNNANVIIQEKFETDEYGLDILNDLDGNFLTCACKKKLGMRAGETDSAEIIHNEKLLDIGKSIATKIRHIGNMDVDCLRVDDEYCIIEMNNRLGGQYPFVHLAGANFPKAMIKMLQGKPIDKDLLTAAIGTIGIKNLDPVVFKILNKNL